MTSTNTQRCFVWFYIVLACLWSSAVMSAEPVGKLMFAVRGVVIQHQDGAQEPGQRGMELIAGDTVITGEKGRAQLLMSDGARIALKPETEFVIESYQAPETTQGADGLVAVTEGSGVLNLIKGGMRAVSGEMTKSNPDGLLVKTPVATMGIRGTGWKCLLVGEGKQTKLYLKVVDGLVVIKTPFGDLNVNPGEIASVIEGQEAQLELGETEEFINSDEQSDEVEDDEEDNEGIDSESTVMGDDDTGENEGTTTQSDEIEEAFIEEVLGVFEDEEILDDLLEVFDEEELAEIIVEIVEELVTPVGAAGTPDSGNAVTAQAEVFVDQFILGENDELLAFIAEFLVTDEPIGASEFSIVDANGNTTAEVQNLGSDPATGFIWGRWSNGTATVSPGLSGSDEDVELSGQHSVHWYHGLADLGNPLADITASASYSLVGNTEPTDANGNVGILGSADLSANFTTGAVDLSLQLGINNQNWSASGSGQMLDSTHLSFSGTNLSGNVSDGTTNIGTVSGQFVGAFSTNIVQSNGVAVPAGAAVGYGLVGDVPGGPTAVSGVAIVGSPQATPAQEPQ